MPSEYLSLNGSGLVFLRSIAQDGHGFWEYDLSVETKMLSGSGRKLPEVESIKRWLTFMVGMGQLGKMIFNWVQAVASDGKKEEKFE